MQGIPLTYIHLCEINRIWSSVLQTDEGMIDVSLWLLPKSSSLNRDLKSFPNISNPFLTEIQTESNDIRLGCLSDSLSVNDGQRRYNRA